MCCKSIVHRINVVTKAPRTFRLTNSFLQEIFHKNIQTIHMHCFSHYQKYLCKIFSMWNSINFNVVWCTINILKTLIKTI